MLAAILAASPILATAAVSDQSLWKNTNMLCDILTIYVMYVNNLTFFYRASPMGVDLMYNV
jgi:hypothetical protein